MKTVDLSLHINQTMERGHAADFPVTLRPVYIPKADCTWEPVPKRYAVVRMDTEEPISVVSNRYALVPHQEILGNVRQALRPLDVGPTPYGLFIDRNGARMRALFKFPALAKAVAGGDEICPCLKIANTYDGSGTVSMQIGAFRFVCTNLAVGGGGVFASGFVSIHLGQIDIDRVTNELVSYLQGFDRIVATYRSWMNTALTPDQLEEVFRPCGGYHAKRIFSDANGGATVYAAFNAASYYATHKTRSFRVAFRLLEVVNREFQKAFPVNQNEAALEGIECHAAQA